MIELPELAIELSKIKPYLDRPEAFPYPMIVRTGSGSLMMTTNTMPEMMEGLGFEIVLTTEQLRDWARANDPSP